MRLKLSSAPLNIEYTNLLGEQLVCVIDQVTTIRLVWALQEFSARNRRIPLPESLRLRGKTNAEGASLSPPTDSRAFGALAHASRSFVDLSRRIESVAKTRETIKQTTWTARAQNGVEPIGTQRKTRLRLK